jgi:glutamine amidotransferase
MKIVAIVDYGLCNLDSIRRAVEECGGHAVVTDRAEDLRTASAIILPGVGAFPDAMANLRARSLPEVLYEQAVEQQIPFLGICLGMQLLATRGYEVRETEGLGWINGEVRRFRPTVLNERIPHIGWNEVDCTADCPLFRGIPANKDFYFVHSFHFRCSQPHEALGTTAYCGGFTSVVGRGLIFGVQFHPEKSQRLGFQVLRNFLAL